MASIGIELNVGFVTGKLWPGFGMTILLFNIHPSTMGKRVQLIFDRHNFNLDVRSLFERGCKLLRRTIRDDLIN